MSSVWFLFQNNRFLLNGKTSDTTPGDHCFQYSALQKYWNSKDKIALLAVWSQDIYKYD